MKHGIGRSTRLLGMALAGFASVALAHHGWDWAEQEQSTLDATVAELTGRGAVFAGEAQEMGFGRGISLLVPGADDMLLYQPHHATAYHLGAGAQVLGFFIDGN